tara:strand:- start:2974 stop:3174 length:201 start_codon:yes stop_codon:yes gene_type:complete
MSDENFYVNVLQLIDVASKRGAWNGPELGAVAEIRNSVVEKLKALNADVEENVEKLSSDVEEAGEE